MSQLQQAINDLSPWFHNLHLPDGTQTAPHHSLGDFPLRKWKEIEPFVPQDLSGWTALDIGCNAGFYTFELAKRGANVVAIDLNPHYLTQARWAAKQYGLQIRLSFARCRFTTSCIAMKLSIWCGSWVCFTTCAIRFWGSISSRKRHGA
jgi:tRNA (mo5U34)-methyltransferase